MVDSNFKQEACQLYIEQEIESRLEQGLSPGKIGKQLTKEINTLFESNVKPATIKKRAQRIGTNVPKSKSTNRDKIGTNKDSIVITDIELVKDIRSIGKAIGCDEIGVLLLAMDMFKRQ